MDSHKVGFFETCHFKFVHLVGVLTLSLPSLAKSKFRPNFQILFCEILKNKQHHVKVQAERIHLNGHIIGFCPQTQKLESHYKTPPSTLAVEGLNEVNAPWVSLIETDHSILKNFSFLCQTLFCLSQEP